MVCFKMWSLNIVLIVLLARYHLVTGLSCYQCSGGVDETECESQSATGLLRKCPSNQDAVCIYENINGVTTRSCGVANYGPACEDGAENRCMCQWDGCNEDMCGCDNGRPVRAGTVLCEGTSCDEAEEPEDNETTPKPKSSGGVITSGMCPLALLSVAILAYQVTQ